ncbi:MAG: carboxypeptidase-like regulatory domain-containing protein, partial [Acidobacteriia bacterium]|nr:carboxypeptidase-like regulatory domain-containing protein [Terriglobia bacterium]
MRLWGLFLITTAAFAQNAGLSGLIRDGSEAVVPYATVMALNTRTGVRRTTRSNPEGYYNLTALQPGIYKVTAHATGFAMAIRDGIELDVAARARLDFKLAVGTVESTIQVDSSSDLSLDDAALSTLISRSIIAEVPQYLRSWDDLAGLVAGVEGYRYTEQPGSPSSHKQGQFSVHGGRQTQNNWILDGMDNNTFSTNTIEDTQLMVRPSIDAVEEFRVITSPYNAEYGRNPGAAISVSSRGGANTFHASLYEYVRNRIFDANTFFANRAGLQKPRNNQNLFGATAGGPVIANKLFWLIDYEGTRTRQGILRQTNVPLPGERLGDFSPETAGKLGVVYPTIYDPATNAPFPGNRVPATRLDTAALKIESYFPQPNSGPSDINDYARNASIVDDTDRDNGRLDWHPDDADSLFARYTFISRHRDVPGFFGGLADGTNTGGWGNRSIASQGALIAWTRVLSPRIVNDFRVSFNRNRSFITQEPFGQGKPSDFIPGIPSDPLSDGGLPQTSIRGYTFIGSPDYLPGLETPTQVQFRDTFSWNSGSHALKFGADWRNMRNVWRDIPATRGEVDFNGQFTCAHDASGLCVGSTGLSYADFLLGQVQEASLSNL